MASSYRLDPNSQEPLYRQLFSQIKSAIESEELVAGDRLPLTRDLAGSLGLNRTTVAAAYELLESEGLIRGHVGRGSFVRGSALTKTRSRYCSKPIVFLPCRRASVSGGCPSG